jgi:hypothetical protein
MKKIKSLFLLSLMLIVGGQMIGQTRGFMYLGASFPMKDFGRFDGFNDFALTTTDATQGGANVGFNVGLKWYFNVGVQGLGVMLSFDGFYNGPNSDLSEVYRNNEIPNGNHVDGYDSTPKYINVPGMLGLNYIYYLNPQFGVYVEAGAGANVCFITEMETVLRSTINGIDTKVRTNQKYDNVFSFVSYQAGVGFEVAKNLRIGCSFYSLGKREVKGDLTVKTTTLDDNVPTTDKSYKTYGTVQPVMILGRIGFSF